MSLLVLTNADIFMGGAKLTGQSNKLELELDNEVLDGTTFGSQGWKTLVDGLSSSDLKVEGFFDAGNLGLPDDSLFANFGSVVPASVSPAPAAVDSLVYVIRGLRSDYKVGDQIGKLLPFQAGLRGQTPTAQGKWASVGTKTVTGNGTGITLPSLWTTTMVVVGLHVLAVSGTAPTLDLTVQGDTVNTFAAPVTLGTFAQVGAGGANTSQFLLVPVQGKSWFRVNHVIGGTGGPSFDFYVSLGLAPK